MERYGKELHFIARIKGDGSGIEPVTEGPKTAMERNEAFKLTCLSISGKTWIASGMGTYVVKLKCDV